MSTLVKDNSNILEKLFKAGAHFGLLKSRRHPSVKPYIFGAKNKVEIFDLEKTSELLDQAKNYVEKIASEGGTILFVGGKNEARNAVRKGGMNSDMPYVDGRWLGGTLTNFSEIRRRVERMESLQSQKERGELAKYTKRERMLIDKEISGLEDLFTGLVNLKSLPKAVFLIDPKREDIALKEAQKLNIPIVALMGSDCNMREIDYPIPANDALRSSIEFFVNEISEAINSGKSKQKVSKEV